MRRLGQFFTVVGTAMAVVAVSAYALGFRPSTLPPALLDLSMYKLAFIAAGCLIAAGAVVGGAVRRRDDAALHSTPAELMDGDAAATWNANVKSHEGVKK